MLCKLLHYNLLTLSRQSAVNVRFLNSFFLCAPLTGLKWAGPNAITVGGLTGRCISNLTHTILMKLFFFASNDY